MPPPPSEGGGETVEGLAEPHIERETGVLQHLDYSNPLRASRPEAAVVIVGFEEFQLSQTVHETGGDTGQVGDLLSCY